MLQFEFKNMLKQHYFKSLIKSSADDIFDQTLFPLPSTHKW